MITVNTARKVEEELEEETRGNPKIKESISFKDGRDLCMFIGCGEGVSGDERYKVLKTEKIIDHNL